jgi:hypothetical protein
MVIKSRMMRWTGHLACLGEIRSAYKILIRKPKRRRPLGIARHRWEDNIKTDLKEIECEDVGWIHLFQDRVQWQDLVNIVMNLQVP